MKPFSLDILCPKALISQKSSLQADFCQLPPGEAFFRQSLVSSIKFQIYLNSQLSHPQTAAGETLLLA